MQNFYSHPLQEHMGNGVMRTTGTDFVKQGVVEHTGTELAVQHAENYVILTVRFCTVPLVVVELMALTELAALLLRSQ